MFFRGTISPKMDYKNKVRLRMEVGGLAWPGVAGLEICALSRKFRCPDKGSRTTPKMVSGHQMDISGDLPAICAGVVLTRQGGARHGYASPWGGHFS